jgi:hypothetical protein
MNKEHIHHGVSGGDRYISQTLSLGLGLCLSEKGTAACSVPIDQSMPTTSRINLDGNGDRNWG